jgi:hypothetical protein
MANPDHLHSDAIHYMAPFSFLHHTTRYHPVTITRGQQHHDVDDLHGQTHSPSPSTTSGDTTPKRTPRSITNSTENAEGNETSQIYHVWRSRDNRKGRHRAVIARQSFSQKGDKTLGQPGPGVKKTLLGLTRLVTRFPVGDVSYLAAVAFVLGLSSSLPLARFSLPPILGGSLTQM